MNPSHEGYGVPEYADGICDPSQRRFKKFLEQNQSDKTFILKKYLSSVDPSQDPNIPIYDTEPFALKLWRGWTPTEEEGVGTTQGEAPGTSQGVGAAQREDSVPLGGEASGVSRGVSAGWGEAPGTSQKVWTGRGVASGVSHQPDKDCNIREASKIISSGV